jgi:hypothetical protein
MKVFITSIAGSLGVNLADFYTKRNFTVHGFDIFIG